MLISCEMISEKPDRIIGEYKAGPDGPLLFVIAGIHGNEPAGIHALHRVCATLHELQPPFKGRIVGLAGNREALWRKMRFINRDLNRLWSEDEIARVNALSHEARNSEEKELKELLRLLDAGIDTPYEPKVFMDLHTTSAPGGLFSIVTENAAIRELAEALYAPIVFNLVNELALTTNRFFDDRNLLGLAFESGQHDDPASIDNHESAIWLMLEKIGCLKRTDIPGFDHYEERLRSAAEKLGKYKKVTYRHPVEAALDFHMRPGYINFQSVAEGEELARDKEGVINSPMAGQMLMPLYQSQGEDGFFVVQELAQPPV